MIFEQFSRGTSLLHRADPRVKIISAFLLTIILALCQNFQTAVSGLFLAVILIITTGLDRKKLLKRLVVINSFNFLLWILLPLTYNRPPMTTLTGIPISLSGLQLAALITIKANSILLLFISLLATSTVADLGYGLQKLKVSPRLCMLLLFSYRYIFVLYQEYTRLYRAATLRCFSPATTIHTYKTYGYLLGMLLVKSWNRAARVQQAMELRGFTGTFHSLHTSRINKRDFFLLAGFAACGLVLLYLNAFFPSFPY